jgi:predicted acetylornithine/succinylornithine family transaminase
LSQTTTTTEHLRERANMFLIPCYGERTTAIVRGRGSRAWDAEGKEYLDFLSGIGVNNLGHCHPAVVAAVKHQAETLMHTSNGVLIEAQVELAELLCTDLKMGKAFFANTGAEVTEAAIKLARLWSLQKFGEGRHRMIVFHDGFHGRTYGAMSATSSGNVLHGFEPGVEGFRFCKFNDLEDVDKHWDDSICAVMLETVQGNGGVIPATAEFLQGLRERCTARNAALICDEVQCGVGRSGKRMAYQWAGVEPDIVPIAKALGGGIPIGAMLARGEFNDIFTKGRHGTTFGGNPLACAAALAACRIIFDDDFLREVGKLGCYLWEKLAEVAKEFPDHCEKVRGVGLMQALVLRGDAVPVVKKAMEKGLIVNATAGNCIRILPPLNTTRDEIDEAADKLRAAFRDIAGKAS